MFNLLSNPLKKGLEFVEQRRYTQAIEFFENFIKEKGANPEAHLNLGKCYFIMEHYVKARENLHAALNAKASPQIISGIIEVTNWRMIAPSHYYNSFPAFSSDGKMLAYVSSRTDTNGDFMINALDAGGIYINYLDSGKEIRVVPDEYMNSFPVFSPDGKKLAYLSQRTSGTSGADNPALYILDLETGKETKLVDESNKIKYPSFMPDGKKIVFVCWRPGDHYSGVYALDLEWQRFETIASGNAYEHAFPTISPVDGKILFTSWRRDTNGDGAVDLRDNSAVFIRDFIKGESEQMIIDDTYNNTFPTFSADGKKIVYLSSRRDSNNDGKIDSFDNAGIYQYDLAKKNETCIVEDVFFNKFPSFMVDDNRLVFISNMRVPTEEHLTRGYFEFKGIYSVKIGSKDIKKIVSEEMYGSRSLVTSPKGDMIAYVSWHHESARGLYVAYLNQLPSPEELHRWIDRNLQQPAE